MLTLSALIESRLHLNLLCSSNNTCPHENNIIVLYVQRYNGNRFTIPLEVFWSEQFTISNEIIKALIITGKTLPPIHHKHVSSQ